MPEDLAPTPFDEPWEYEIRIPRDPRGPGIARTTLRAVLDAHGLPELTMRAELLASELATNAVRYADGPAGVRIAWWSPVLRVSVWDTCSELPDPLAFRTEAVDGECERGRGLYILDVVADRWGGLAIGEDPFGVGGKTVWFELGAGKPPQPPGAAATVPV